MTLTSHFEADPYRSYTYGYPHKTAYRQFVEPVDLQELWSTEDQSRLFGYLHLPFCEMRCGFCNLFTTANPSDDLVERYLDALEREVATMRGVLDHPSAAQFAIGGGTPTYLTPDQLNRCFDLLESLFRTTLKATPTAIETSPATATADRLALLAERGVHRVSIGVQSMIDSEVQGVGRPQHQPSVERALTLIKESGIPVLNVDLMYGLAHQTPTTWLASLDKLLRWEPDEVFCYPLYVRPKTGLDGHANWDDQRRELYRIAVQRLTDAGFRQTSLRRFTRVAEQGHEYSCQTDGMVGLGCGARSYTRAVHYSREWAVGRTGVRHIIADYCDRSDFGQATYGVRLPPAEQLRRFVLQSLLHVDGLDPAAAQHATGLSLDDELPQLRQLVAEGLAENDSGRLKLTPLGLELSDAIGPWLYSDSMIELGRTFDLR